MWSNYGVQYALEPTLLTLPDATLMLCTARIESQHNAFVGGFSSNEFCCGPLCAGLLTRFRAKFMKLKTTSTFCLANKKIRQKSKDDR